jgi:AraC-like DNA-binding protein
MHTSVRSATLHGYADLARSLGLDPRALMGQVGLDPADLSVPDAWISAPAVARLLHASAAAAGRPDFPLLLAERRRLSALGPLSVVLREEPDLRSVVHLLMRHERSYNEALRIRLAEDDDLASVRLWFEFGEPAPVEQALALGVGALFGILGECGGQGWRPLSVCFSYEAPRDLDGYRRLFGPALRFEHEFTGLVLYASDLAAGNALSDPLMRPYATRILDSVVSPRSATWSGRVKEVVELLLPLGRCSVDQVARTLRVDRRTLQRRLLADGSSFAAILQSTRAGLAQRYLSNDRYSITEVSDLLGFAAPSAFSRWFAQQFGVSPRAWRTTTAGRAPAT